MLVNLYLGGLYVKNLESFTVSGECAGNWLVRALPGSKLGFCPVRMILRSPHHPQRPLKFARKLHPSKCAFGTEDKRVRLTGGGVKCFSSKQSGALNPGTHAPGGPPPVLLLCPRLLQTATESMTFTKETAGMA